MCVSYVKAINSKQCANDPAVGLLELLFPFFSEELAVLDSHYAMLSSSATTLKLHMEGAVRWWDPYCSAQIYSSDSQLAELQKYWATIIRWQHKVILQNCLNLVVFIGLHVICICLSLQIIETYNFRKPNKIVLWNILK